MSFSNIFRLKGFSVPRTIAELLMVSLGLTVGAIAQNPDDVALWREWMSVLQREPSQTSGPRIYLMTDREILQTSASTAQFQNGRYRMVLADGSVPDVDGDVDYYTDVFEDGNAWAYRDDPALIPRDDKGNPLPIDAFPILMADGSVLGIALSTLDANTQATSVKPGSGLNVRVVGAPASGFQRPVPFADYSSLFYYYYSSPGQTTGAYQQFPLSLYHLQKDYPNPQDGNALETTMVPGAYTVEYPTIVNPPTGKANASVIHRLVPNGALTVGLKKPTWLIRSLTSIEKSNTPPVAQQWVNGRLKFDPYLPLTINWDSLLGTGLASSADYIDVWIEDEEGFRISYDFRVNATTSTLSFDQSGPMIYEYGSINQRIAGDPLYPGGPQTPALHEAINGHIVMEYRRYANRQPTADISSVTVRVPVEMSVSYASWRKAVFPGPDGVIDSISGPNADPDGDGLTNLQEFNLGSNPALPPIRVTLNSPTSLTANSVVLNANSVTDGSVTITERGFVYAEASVNPNPVIGGAGVVNVISTGTTGAFSESLTGLTKGTQYAYKAYLITDQGTIYTAPVATFTTRIPPTVVSPSVSQITQSSAVLGAWVFSAGDSSVTERGFVYSVASLNADPLIGGNDVVKVKTSGTTGVYSINITGLAVGTTYNFKGYAINQGGAGYTSTVLSFTTPASLATVTVLAASNVTGVSAELGGNVTSDGGSPISERGIVYAPTALNSNPLINGPSVVKLTSAGSTGTFAVDAFGLTPGTSYSVRSYAINSLGVSYSSQIVTFVTSNLPVVDSPTSTSVLATSATLGGRIVNDGGAPINQRGVVYSTTNPNPVIGGPGVFALPATGTALGVYTVNTASPLESGKVYYFRAYAANSVGTGYSTVGQFATLSLPLVTSPTSADITGSSATLGGNVVNDGGASITQRGVVISSTNPDPVIGGAGVYVWSTSGTTGVFTVNVSGLSSTTGYAFKAFAKTSRGVSYSELGLFITPTTASLGALTIADVTSTSATLGASVTSDGGTAIIERGLIYSVTTANSNPLIGGAGVVKVPVAGMTGTFTQPIAGLSALTNYTFKAYAINSAGAAYSTPWAFFTTIASPVITSPSSSTITASSAKLGGKVTSDGGTSITVRGVVVSSSNTDPVIGGLDVADFHEYGTTGTFVVDAPGLTSSTQYYFKAYATNSGGTSYTTVGTFTTLPLQLTGLSQVQWLTVEVASRQIQSEGGAAPAQAAAQTVPVFVYLIPPSELLVPLKYQIEVSADFKAWQPIDGNDWQVDETSEALTATWNSTDKPPARVFFRVSALPQ